MKETVESYFDARQHDCDVIHAGQEEGSDGASIPDMLDHG